MNKYFVFNSIYGKKIRANVFFSLLDMFDFSDIAEEALISCEITDFLKEIIIKKYNENNIVSGFNEIKVNDVEIYCEWELKEI